MKKQLVILMLPFVSTGAMAEWTSVGRTTDDSAIYADLATIHKAGNKIVMLDLKDYQTEQGGAGARFLSKTTLLEYDCKEELFRRLTVTLFRENMGAGRVVDSYSGAPGKWQPAQLGSVIGALWHIACEYAAQHSD